MKHNIRQKVLDPVRGVVTKVVTIDGELGSGITDKNGVEIFEGDIVQYMAQYEIRGEVGEVPETLAVTFEDGAFVAGDEYLCDFVDQYKNPEVVGHVDD